MRECVCVHVCVCTWVHVCMCIFMRVCLCFKDGAATAEDVTYADLTLAGMADRKWETENEDTVYAGIQPIGRDNV